MRLRQGFRMDVHHQLLARLQRVRPLALLVPALLGMIRTSLRRTAVCICRVSPRPLLVSGRFRPVSPGLIIAMRVRRLS